MEGFVSILYSIAAFIAAIGILVTIHEFGHFWVARRCGVRVEQFSIGFGTPLYKWRDKHDTEFILAALPLGGYVKMLDERSGDVCQRIYLILLQLKNSGSEWRLLQRDPWLIFYSQL
jgi:regulator of sigma E protease